MDVKLEDLCPDFPQWPESWMGIDKDKEYGEGLLEAIRPFVEHLIASGLTKKTIRRHLDNLWLLGGEIIRDVNLFDEYHVAPMNRLISAVDDCGGMYCRHLSSKQEQESYDRTCRKLYRFLNTQ